MSSTLYNKGIYGYVTVDFIAFQDPYTKDSQPLFWANGISLQYTSFNSVYSLINATLSTNYRQNSRSNSKGFMSTTQGFGYRDARAVVSVPFISQPSLPSSNFKSFFHLARLGNLFYDVAQKRGIIFIVADSLQNGSMGVVSIDVDIQSAYTTLLKCLNFLKK